MSNLGFAVQDRANEAVRFVNSGFVSLLDSRSLRPVFDALAEPYLAGHSLDEGIEAGIDMFRNKGTLSTFDILGERPENIEGANRIYDGNLRILDMIAEKMPGMTATLSTKLTSICAVEQNPDGSVRTDQKGRPAFFRQTNPLTRLETLVATAKDRRINVTLDMEESVFTDASLLLADYLWGRGYDNFGIVLQSRLHRTQDDIQKYLVAGGHSAPAESQRVRAVIGIYQEPRSIAVGKSEAKTRLVQRVKELLNKGAYVEVGTHDLKVIDRIMNDVVIPMNIDSSRIEFQFLRGVHNGDIAGQMLRGENFTTRYYMPVELQPGDGHPYMVRRLRANPQIALAGAKNVIQKALYSGNGKSHH